jgi:hypothetical protein
MGVVRFAIGFPHTFYVVAAPIPFRAMTAGIRMPAEILHARDLTIKGVQFSMIFGYGAKLDRRFRRRSALLSNGQRCSLSSPRRMRRSKSTETSPTSRKTKWSISRSRSAR